MVSAGVGGVGTVEGIGIGEAADKQCTNRFRGCAGGYGALSKVLNNLADILRSQPDRLPESRQLAEESLAIKVREGEDCV
jgi:hypothetical protein